MVFLQGLLLGLCVAAPVGPIGVLCIQRTLRSGKLSGFVSGLGAATADGLYGAVAAFGLVFISNMLIEQLFVLRLVGGTFLFYIGLRSFLSRATLADAEVSPTKGRLVADYVSTVFLTITNPMTILSFAALFAGIGFGFSEGKSFFSASLLTLGVFFGSALWWLVLSIGVGWLKSRIPHFSILTVNKISGFVIMSFAAYILWGMFV